MIRTRRRLVPAALLGIVALVSSCTAEARNDAAKSLFVKAVNLKCKVMKSEAKLAWNLADELGAGSKALEIQTAASNQTDKLLAEINRLDGPANVRKEVGSFFLFSNIFRF